MTRKGEKEKKKKKGLFSNRDIDATKRNYKREVLITCPTCRGSGRRGIGKCGLCRGKGKVYGHP